MGNDTARIPSPRHGPVRERPSTLVMDVANSAVSQLPYPLLSIRQEAQGQQSLRVSIIEQRREDGKHYVADLSG